MSELSNSERHELLERIRELSSPMEPEPTQEIPVLTKLDGIRAIVFDFYGTMFISGTGDTIVEAPGEVETDAFEKAFKTVFPALEDQPDPQTGVDLYQRAISDLKEKKKQEGVDYPEVNILEVWENVLGQLRQAHPDLPENPDSALLKRMTVEYEMRENPTWPMPDLRETLDALDKTVMLGILSNSQFYTPRIYEAHYGTLPSQDVFEVNLCIWSYEEELCKPSLDFHKRLKRSLMDHHGLKPEQVLYVGNDMLKDIYPAAHFGFKTALFAGDNRSLKWRKDDDRCKNLVPDLVITRLSQLTDCMGL